PAVPLRSAGTGRGGRSRAAGGAGTRGHGFPRCGAVRPPGRGGRSRVLCGRAAENSWREHERRKRRRDHAWRATEVGTTLLGMSIDVETVRPRLARVVGGLSGPAIKPIALRMVWQVAAAISIPVVGMGGIMTAEDAVEFMLAGASAVQIGTGTFRDPEAAEKTAAGIRAYMVRHKMTAWQELVGAGRI
ncbi:MAG: hypothetical protein HGA76_07275, partial [Candidatus Firestonebacteria bacterium]|nr:hypothetical protein [Candidatus Firestonebacteria bacterium]